MSGESATRSWLVDLLIAAVVVVAALVPRLADRDVFLTPDELRWTCRSANFHRALATGELAETYQKEHPGVITMWLGGIGLPVDPDSSWSIACHELEPSKIVGATSPETLAMITGRLFDGRARIALFVSLGIGALYLLATMLFDRRIALLAAVLVLLDPLYLANARVMHLDAVTTTLMTLSLVSLLVYLLRRPNAPMLILSAVLGGMAALNKAPAMFLAPMVVLLVTAIGWRRGDNWRSMAWRVVGWGVVALVTYVALWPAMWVSPVAAVSGVLGGALGYAAEPHEGSNYFWGAIRPDPGPLFYPVSFVFRATPFVLLGLALAIVSLLRRRGDEEERLAVLALLAFALLFTLFMTTGQKKFDRYLLPVYPALVLVGSVGLGAGLRWIGARFQVGARSDRVDRVVWLGGLAVITTVQLALILPHRPYYLSYYNPLVGGSRAAEWALLVGWGEGIDQPARYLNELPGVEEMKVATRYRSAFGPLFRGRTLEMDDYDPATLDYYLLYLNQIQRDLDPELIPRLLGGATEPELVASIAGIDYAWLYRNDNYEAPLALIESRAQPGDVVVARGDSLLAKHYSGVVPLVEIDSDADAEELLEALDQAFETGARVWYVRYDDIYPRPGLAAVDYELATRTFTLEEHEFPEVEVKLLRGDGQGRFGQEVQLEPVEVSFGNVELGLTGVGFAAVPVQWGRELGVALQWEAPDSIDRDLTAFLHLIGPDGHRWAQADLSVTGADLVPTSEWAPDTVALDKAHLAIPAGTPPGDYGLLIGVYDSATGDRLPAFQGDEALPDDVLSLPVAVARAPDEPSRADLGLDYTDSAQLTDIVRLEGHSAVGGVEGGGTASLMLVWSAAGVPETDYGVGLSVLDAAGDLVGTARFEALTPGLSTTQWQTGDVLRGWYEVLLDGRALAGDGTLVVELLGADGRPMPTGATIAEVPLTITGPVRLFEIPAGAGAAVGADLGGRVTLVAAAVPDGAVRPGATVPVTLTWRADRLLDVPYTAFVHVVAADGATFVAQADGQPVGGSRPTTSWLAGEMVTDMHAVELPTDLPPGRYEIRVGMYDPSTVQNLIVTDARGERPPDARAVVGQIEVR